MACLYRVFRCRQLLLRRALLVGVPNSGLEVRSAVALEPRKSACVVSQVPDQIGHLGNAQVEAAAALDAEVESVLGAVVLDESVRPNGVEPTCEPDLEEGLYEVLARRRWVAWRSALGRHARARST